MLLLSLSVLFICCVAVAVVGVMIACVVGGVVFGVRIVVGVCVM